MNAEPPHPDRGMTPPAYPERQRLERLQEAYTADPYYRRIWRADSPASRSMAQRKWDLIRDILRQESVDLRGAWLLDLGVGSGEDGARFLDLGVEPGRFVGLDLVQAAARDARATHPWMSSLAADAGSLPFRDGSFDLVYQSTMLSSVLSPALRQRILREAGRILRPGGMLLSYDTRYPNPWNPNTRPLRVTDLKRALSGWTVRARSATAIPQLQRAVAPLAPAACRLLEAIPFLRSHWIVLARKPLP